MELKAVAPVPVASGPPTLASSAGLSLSMPPSVMTFAQENIMSSPRAMVPPPVLSDPVGSVLTPSHEHLSNIASFTPTRTTPTHGPAVRVPATSDITPSHSNTASPHHRHTPTAGASGSASATAFGSNGSSNPNNSSNSSSNVNNQHKPPYSSSPLNGPIPSSRLSNGNPSHVSSSGSSHRNLFPSLNPSLTQTSANAGPSATVEGNTRKVVITYGKAPAEGSAGMLATMPLVTTDPRRRLSPTKPIVPVAESVRRRVLSPDEPDEADSAEVAEELEPEEQVEDRPVPVSAPAAVPRSATKMVEVVLPPRSTTKSARPSPEKETRDLPQAQARHLSPDPLDANIFRPSATPSTAGPPSSALSRDPLSPVKPSSKSTASSSKSRTKAMTPASTSRSARGTTAESQGSDTTAGPMRVSKRVQVQREKEEAEKEARRVARRIRKEKERLEAERKEAELGRGPKRGRGQDEEEEESIVPLEPPAKRTPTRRGTKSPLKRKKDDEAEVIVVEDETLVSGEAVQRKSAAEDKDDAEAERNRNTTVDGVVAGDYKEARSKATRHATAPATGQKKRKRILDDNEDEDEDWAGEKEGTEANVEGQKDGESDEQPQPAEMLEPDVAVPIAPSAQKKGKKGKATPKGKGKGKKGAEVEVAAVVASVEKPAAADAAVEQKDAEVPADKETGREAEEEAEDGLEGTKSAYFASKSGGTEQNTSVSPAKSVSPVVANGITPRPPLKQSTSSLNTPNRASPGPSNTPGGIKWKTQRSDLASVLSKFGGARQSGMSRRSKIVSLHSKIGPPVKSLPPPPPKPSKKKKDEEEDEEDSDEAEMESDGEGGVRKKKKERGMEWYMVED